MACLRAICVPAHRSDSSGSHRDGHIHHRSGVILNAVQRFNTFTPANDPRGEHDFGVIPWYQERTYWKIDYYDQALQHGLGPLDPDCRRVMTILLASEY